MPKVNEKSRLTFVEQTVFGSQAKAIYKCVCGNTKELHINAVKRQLVRSCGCLQAENRRNGKTHGLYYHPLHWVWSSMKNRCYNPKNQDYKNYGGRGVIVCEEWRNDFKSFYDWCMANGWQKELQLDKDVKAKELGVENDLYSPERCCFVTPKRNSNNRSSNKIIEYNGVSKTLAEWSEELKICGATLSTRMNELGWSIEKAFTTPLRKLKTRKAKLDG